MREEVTCLRILDIEVDSNIDDIIGKLRNDVNTRKGGYLIKPPKKSGKYRMVQCPFHKDGQEQSPSMGIKNDGSVCHCFTCGVAKSLPELIYKCTGVNGKEWLQDNFDCGDFVNRSISVSMSRENVSDKKKYVSDEVLQYYKKKHPYMYQRKLTDEIIDMFDVGYDEQTNCLTFPVKDVSGRILFFAKRSVSTKYFHYPEDVEKPIYGLYEAYKYGGNEVYLCESILDALFIWACGKHAVALNGLGSDTQIDTLKKSSFRTIILALDNDERGKMARQKWKRVLKNKNLYEIDYKSYGNCKDINDMSREQFLNANLIKCNDSFDRG